MQSPTVLLCNPGINSFYSELIRRGEVEEARRYLEVCARVPDGKTGVPCERGKEKKTREARTVKSCPKVQDVARVMQSNPGGMTAISITAALGLHSTSVPVINRRLWRGKARGWFVLLEGVGQFAIYDLTTDGAEWAKHGSRSNACKAARKQKDIECVQSALDGFVAAGKPFTMVDLQRKAGIYPSWFTKNKDWYYKAKAVQQSLNPENKRTAPCVSSISFTPDTLSS